MEARVANPGFAIGQRLIRGEVAAGDLRLSNLMQALDWLLMVNKSGGDQDISLATDRIDAELTSRLVSGSLRPDELRADRLLALRTRLTTRVMVAIEELDADDANPGFAIGQRLVRGGDQEIGLATDRIDAELTAKLVSGILRADELEADRLPALRTRLTARVMVAIEKLDAELVSRVTTGRVRVTSLELVELRSVRRALVSGDGASEELLDMIGIDAEIASRLVSGSVNATDLSVDELRLVRTILASRDDASETLVQDALRKVDEALVQA